MNELVHTVFERQAASTPDAIALELGDARMTYADLDRRAGAVAGALQARGVRPDQPVGLLAERTFEMVIGLLGILKAGAAFLPLDPSYPRARLEQMLGDAEVRVMVTTRSADVPVLAANPAVVHVDTITATARRTPPPLTLDHLAYLIYTSGSTGRPKGVLVSHRGITNLARAQIRAFRVEPASRVLQFASLCFDASVSEIFMALLAGATLVLAPASELRPGAELARTLRERRITTVTLPPSVLAVLPLGDFPDLPDLATIITAGEPLTAELCALWGRARHLVNAYGPSEATVCATIAGDVAAHRRVTIGRAMDGMRAYVLDGDLREIATGGIGEIYVAGLGLARGYLGHPGLTAARFVCDPFGEPGERMYRTGDLGRVTETGDIEFVGRTDQQVKVRGFRIELGEVEAALRELPGVRDAVVIVRTTPSGQPRLVAFVISQVGPAAMRAELSARLPEYMIPAFVQVEAFPLTPNQKVDRAALAVMALPAEVVTQGPRSDLEQLVAQVWARVLGVDRDPNGGAIDVFASFFDLGGDSLRAAMVTNELQELLGETVYVVALFDHPTIATLAAYLELHYPQPVAHVLGREIARRDQTEPKITPATIDHLKRLMSELSPYVRADDRPRDRNPRAVFVLSPPRSGSTLFRVMLAGNPALFVPQELGLLAFDRLGQHRILSNGYEWISQGTIRTLMEIHGWTVEQAKAHLARCEARKLPTHELYREIQDRVAPKLLVDKTTTYALDRSILERAERDFERPYYIHLLRHPGGMVRSFVKVRMDRFFFRWDDRPRFGPHRLAELVWTICHQHTVEFLRTIPADRKYVIRYEDVVRDPTTSMQRLCAHMGIAFDAGMARPHSDSESKMVDGIHASSASRQIGDPNFDKHKDIDASVADAWKAELAEASLGDITRALAASFGY
jgi:amino acid adenylation domain-containing protein